jgi:hypothetical protein
MEIRVGKSIVSIDETEVPYVGKPMDTASGEALEQQGQATKFKIQTTDGLLIQYVLLSWTSANREIRLLESFSGETKYEPLSKGTGRLAINKVGQNELFLLRALKYNTKTNKANLATANLNHLNEWAEQPIQALLESCGAYSVGTKEELLGDQGPNKKILSVLIPPGNTLAPIIAFTITRVLAIMHDYGLDD